MVALSDRVGAAGARCSVRVVCLWLTCGSLLPLFGSVAGLSSQTVVTTPTNSLSRFCDVRRFHVSGIRARAPFGNVPPRFDRHQRSARGVRLRAAPVAEGTPDDTPTAPAAVPPILVEPVDVVELDVSDASNDRSSSSSSELSLREMLGFAIPALGIFLSNPLLSNIDNAFVGRFAGVSGLAALSPATIVVDQVLYLFSFLGRATTGLVSRAYASEEDPERRVAAARRAAAAPLTVSLLCGAVLSVLYALFTPTALRAFGVDPSLIPAASSYAYQRGAVAWAALAQSVALSVSLATRDAFTPLRIVGAAAALNVIGDCSLCAWPLRLGVSGAAAATAGATLASCAMMMRSLRRKNLLPEVRRWPSREDLRKLNEFTGPLFAITVTRMIGFVSMQRKAATLGVEALAAYQLGVNVLIFFLLFGEPLSQLSQTKLPALVDRCDLEASDAAADLDKASNEDNARSLRRTIRSIGSLAVSTALVVGACAFSSLAFGAKLFTADPGVVRTAARTAPVVALAVATSVCTVAVDGAMLASRDFGFILATGTVTMTMQVLFLRSRLCSSLNDVFGTFIFRLGTYGIGCAVRTALGYGALGRAVRCVAPSAETTNVDGTSTSTAS